MRNLLESGCLLLKTVHKLQGCCFAPPLTSSPHAKLMIIIPILSNKDALSLFSLLLLLSIIKNNIRHYYYCCYDSDSSSSALRVVVCWKQDDTLDKSPGHHRVHRETKNIYPFTHTHAAHTPQRNVAIPNGFNCMVLDRWEEPEHPERSHTAIEAWSKCFI